MNGFYQVVDGKYEPYDFDQVIDASKCLDCFDLFRDQLMLAVCSKTLHFVPYLRPKNIIYVDNKLDLPELRFVFDNLCAGVRIELAADLSLEKMQAISAILKPNMVVSLDDAFEFDTLKQFVANIPNEVLFLCKFTNELLSKSLLSLLKPLTRVAIHPDVKINKIDKILPFLPHKVIFNFYQFPEPDDLKLFFQLLPEFVYLQLEADIAKEFLIECIKCLRPFQIFLSSLGMHKSLITQALSLMTRKSIYCPHHTISELDLHEVLDELPVDVYYYPNHAMNRELIRRSLTWWDYNIYIDSGLSSVAEFIQENSLVFTSPFIQVSEMIELVTILNPGVIFQTHVNTPNHILRIALEHLNANTIFQPSQEFVSRSQFPYSTLKHLSSQAIFMTGQMFWNLFKNQIKALNMGAKLMFNPYIHYKELVHFVGLVKPGLCLMIHPNTPSLNVYGIFVNLLPFTRLAFFDEHDISLDNLLLCCANLAKHVSLEMPKWLGLEEACALVQAIPAHSTIIFTRIWSLEEHIKLIKHMRAHTIYQMVHRPEEDISDFILAIPRYVSFAPQFKLSSKEIGLLQTGRHLILPELPENQLLEMCMSIPAGVILSLDDKTDFDKVILILSQCPPYVIYKPSILIFKQDLKQLCAYLPKNLIFMLNQWFSFNQLRIVFEETRFDTLILISHQLGSQIIQKFKPKFLNYVIEQDKIEDNLRALWFKRSGQGMFFNHLGIEDSKKTCAESLVIQRKF